MEVAVCTVWGGRSGHSRSLNLEDGEQRTCPCSGLAWRCRSCGAATLFSAPHIFLISTLEVDFFSPRFLHPVHLQNSTRTEVGPGLCPHCLDYSSKPEAAGADGNPSRGGDRGTRVLPGDSAALPFHLLPCRVMTTEPFFLKMHECF